MEAVWATAVPVEQLDDVSLHEAVIEAQREIDLLSARQARLLARWRNRRIWENDGSKSAGSRLARETGLSQADANHLIRRARKLDSMPHCMKAFEDGELSISRVDLLVRANQSSLTSQFAHDEELLLDTVKNLRFADALRAVRYWIQLADDDDSEDKGKKQVEGRNASTNKTFEGTIDLRALFDPVNGEIVLNEHERLIDELFKQDWAEAKAIHGDDVKVEHLKRTPAQRRCDALVLMAKRSASANGVNCNRPLLSVIVDDKTVGRICELASGTVITPGQIVPLLSEADIERIVFDGKSRVIDVSRKRRFTGALRRAIEIRDRHCQDSSECDEPASNCQGDHIEPYVKGGKTEQSNGRMLCDKHNRGKGAGPP